MKSFHLDRRSITNALESLPAIILGSVLVAIVAYFGMLQLWVRIVMVLICATYGGFLIRGTVGQRYRARYPGAVHVWLLTIGMTTAILGVAGRMALDRKSVV
jgi:hypothetical protein